VINWFSHKSKTFYSPLTVGNIRESWGQV